MNSPRPALALILFALAACNCQPATPSPVTFRIKNTLGWSIFVSDGDNRAGVVVQRPTLGGWEDLTEALPCECRTCDRACTGCSCNTPAPMVRQVRGGATFERTWSGEWVPKASRSCFLGPVEDCYEDSRAVGASERLRAQLCFANRLASPAPPSDRFAGTLPSQDLVCVTREFTVPVDGIIELSPPEPAGCTLTTECKTGELCQNGLCSSSCLPSNVPALGGSWTVEVGSPDNQGFFQVVTPASGRRLFFGRGTVGTVRYDGGNVRLSLYRDDPVLGRLVGEMYLTLPGGRGVPMSAGDAVDVTVVESTESGRANARAAVVRRGGVTIIVADAGRGGPILTPDDMQPFSVSTEGEPFACDPGDCGRKMHRQTTFAAAGKSVNVRPGETQTLLVGGYRYLLVPVGNYKYEFDGCGPRPVTPFAVLVDAGT